VNPFSLLFPHQYLLTLATNAIANALYTLSSVVHLMAKQITLLTNLGGCRTIHDPAANPAVWPIFQLLFDQYLLLLLSNKPKSSSQASGFSLRPLLSCRLLDIKGVRKIRNPFFVPLNSTKKRRPGERGPVAAQTREQKSFVWNTDIPRQLPS